MAAGDLTTLENAKKFLGLTTATDDALVGRLVSAASAWIKTFLNRDVLQGTYLQTLDGTGGPRIFVSQFPVTAISTCTVNGVSVDPGGIVPRGAMLTRTDGGIFTKGLSNIVIGYTAGYAVVPGDIEQACIEIVAWRFKEKDRIGHASKTIQGEVVAFQTRDVPESVKTLLLNFRKVVPA